MPEPQELDDLSVIYLLLSNQCQLAFSHHKEMLGNMGLNRNGLQWLMHIDTGTNTFTHRDMYAHIHTETHMHTYLQTQT